jgi:type III secretion system (T3SS) SseB-like protein
MESMTVLKRNIPGSGFSDDDGSADPRLAAALAAWAEDRAAEQPVLDALRDARLLVPVVAVLGELDEPAAPQDAAGSAHHAGGSGKGQAGGLRREKTSDMAVPTLRAAGRTALPAFTSTAALARWDPAARPVAVPLHQALQAAAQERADTIVLDLAGPVPYQLTGAALRALAAARTGPLADPGVRAAIRAALAAQPAVLAARLGPGPADGTLALVLDPAAGEAAAMTALRNLAERLAADETLRARLVRGLDLAVLPAARPAAPGVGGASAGEVFYERSPARQSGAGER